MIAEVADGVGTMSECGDAPMTPGAEPARHAGEDARCRSRPDMGENQAGIAARTPLFFQSAMKTIGVLHGLQVVQNFLAGVSRCGVPGAAPAARLDAIREILGKDRRKAVSVADTKVIGRRFSRTR